MNTEINNYCIEHVDWRAVVLCRLVNPFRDGDLRLGNKGIAKTLERFLRLLVLLVDATAQCFNGPNSTVALHYNLQDQLSFQVLVAQFLWIDRGCAGF